MFRLPGVDGSPDRAAVEAEKRKAKQNVAFTMKVFVTYVAFLRLGEISTVSSWIKDKPLSCSCRELVVLYFFWGVFHCFE